MKRLSRSSLAAVLTLGLFACLSSGRAGAQEPIRLARTPDISPDGKLVAFSYLGDLWIVETIGGTARAVTSHPAHDINPVFSPDGRKLAFSSNRHGSYDVYVVPIQGGRPRRLTFDSANDMVAGWSPDGKSILFASTRSTTFPPAYQLYTIPAEGGMARRITAAEGKNGVFSPRGDLLAYVRGPGSWYRKGYRGSSNDDIWLCKSDGSDNRRLTSFNGQDASPMWSADGNSVYYVSEMCGTPANIVKAPANPQGLSPQQAKPIQITFHKDDSVRHARISRNGEWIVYECGADLWVVSTRASNAPAGVAGAAPASQPRKLAIEVNADDKVNPETIKTFTDGATEFSLSRDEKFLVFALHGKLFRMPVSPKEKGGKVTQLTDGAWNDHGAVWAPDGSRIAFLSDRNGREDVYTLEPNDPEHPRLTEARHFKVKQLTSTADAELGLNFTPDGKRLSFLRAGKLWTMNPDGTDQKAVISDVHVFDYDWSPDSRWVVYARSDGSFASEMFIAPATGPTAENPARNVTRYATSNGDVTWSLNGKAIAFLSARRGSGNVHVLPLRKPAAPGYSERTFGSRVVIDWDDIHLRARHLGSASAATVAIAPDAARVAYLSGGDLWVADTNGGSTTRLASGASARQITWSRQGTSLSGYKPILFFLDGSGSIRAAHVGSSSTLTLPFKVKMTVRTEEVYQEMFDQSWRYLAEHFYDNKFHGRDWNAVRAHYRPLVKHIALKEDLYALLYLMMGELNASHLGISGHRTIPDEFTADLGLIFDESYRGPGLKVAEVLKRGPADRRGINLKAGDVVLSIDGTDITPALDLSKLLNGKTNEQVLLEVVTPVGSTVPTDKKSRRRVEVQAVSRGRVLGLMYERWVDNNAKRVAELSKGKLGYIHIPSMDDEGLDRFVRSLYSDNFDKEGIVLDVRYNGGGFTHDRVLNYLGGHEHTRFRRRDGGEGLVLRADDRKWTKPLVLLINNQSYSDAEIFPNAFRTLGLGKLVGQQTGGMVIGTVGVRLVDGSTFRLPRIGVYTTRGVNMEKEGVHPDVLIEPHPDQLAKGVDVQLHKAVEVLQTDVVLWKKSHSGAAASARGTTPPPSMPPAAK